MFCKFLVTPNNKFLSKQNHVTQSTCDLFREKNCQKHIFRGKKKNFKKWSNILTAIYWFPSKYHVISIKNFENIFCTLNCLRVPFNSFYETIEKIFYFFTILFPSICFPVLTFKWVNRIVSYIKCLLNFSLDSSFLVFSYYKFLPLIFSGYFLIS